MRQYILRDNNSIFLVYLIVAVSYSLTTCAITMALLLYRIFEDYEWVEETEENYLENENNNTEPLLQ